MNMLSELENDVKMLEDKLRQSVADSNAVHGALQYATNLLAKAREEVSKLEAEVKNDNSSAPNNG